MSAYREHEKEKCHQAFMEWESLHLFLLLVTLAKITKKGIL
jgi:hypothetical protein